MAKTIFHPETDQIELTTVLEALSDPIRRDIILGLFEDGEQNCSAFNGLSSKTNLTYHYVRLREAGLTRTRPMGTHRLITLRADDIESRFPGLLAAILAAARAERLQRQAEDLCDALSSAKAAGDQPHREDGA
ncbi:helix-turn-helix transcriptional regulator [Labrys sp. ZIDIC5]|uniref:helix-turn-helix transcriptional regulator n=1 Tax=Labrys sedimenti TaxID=3106036 RepID=UPI002ACAAD8D|nr:helix-turn-helix transcriptional regulator [Labrys sp. ZIDIC5]MDZ5451986.1 helix-turn-helix transcriptional regulator [Labrys sp. ZIDIC5]